MSRPKGSKNKPKPAEPEIEITPEETINVVEVEEEVDNPKEEKRSYQLGNDPAYKTWLTKNQALGRGFPWRD